MTPGADPPRANGIHALVVPSDQEPYLQLLTSTDLRTLQRLIGGFVEIHYPALSWHLYCHEGSSVSLPQLRENPTATNLALTADPSFAVVIRGIAVIVGTGYRGEDHDAPEELLRQLAEPPPLTGPTA